MGLLLYGAGQRLLEALQLRVKDIDFAINQIAVRDGKGQKDRVTIVAGTAKPLLMEHLKQVRRTHEQDLRQASVGSTYRILWPEKPSADREWGWQYVFPATDLSIDPCYPATIGIAHVHNLLTVKSQHKPLNIIFFPRVDVLHSSLVNLTGIDASNSEKLTWTQKELQPE